MGLSVILSICPSVGPRENRYFLAVTAPQRVERPRDASCQSVLSFNGTIYLELQIYQCVQMNSVLFSSVYALLS